MAEAQMELYDMAKQLVANENPTNPLEYTEKLSDIAEYFITEQNEYLMLLCRELNDYTVFHIKDVATKETLKKEIAETISNRGSLVIVDKSDTHYELWVRMNDKDYCYLLFSYDLGIVEVN